MRKGGYKIIDFKGANFASGTAKTVAGVYNKILECDKRIVLSGVSLGNVLQKDIEVVFGLNSTNLVGYFSAGASAWSVTITNANAVTFTAQ